MKTPKIIKRIFYNQVWDIPNNENKIFLTFDDGPTPEITDWVLNVLKKENVKATFFCIGNNIEKHPAIFNRIINEKHAIGNHTYNHLKGWKTVTKTYLENVFLCESISKKQTTDNNKLFRPPYGKIKLSQSISLRKKGYKIIMWDVLTKDYDTSISKEKCLENATKNTTSGSIIVFHDSIKAYPNLEYTLPKTIQLLKERGFVFDVIQ
jgi:peptidoglycan-N-acetylglucosamine deacetylase